MTNPAQHLACDADPKVGVHMLIILARFVESSDPTDVICTHCIIHEQLGVFEYESRSSITYCTHLFCFIFLKSM